MTDERFKNEIYEPYLEAWKALKLIQYADQTDDTAEQWERYKSEIDRLSKTYPDNKYINGLIDLLLDAGDYIAKVNTNEH